MSDNQPFWSWGWETPQSWGTSCPPRRRWRSCLGNYYFLIFSAHNTGNLVFLPLTSSSVGSIPRDFMTSLSSPRLILSSPFLSKSLYMYFLKLYFLHFRLGKRQLPEGLLVLLYLLLAHLAGGGGSLGWPRSVAGGRRHTDDAPLWSWRSKGGERLRPVKRGGD